jgi:hypothetical protein
LATSRPTSDARRLAERLGSAQREITSGFMRGTADKREKIRIVRSSTNIKVGDFIIRAYPAAAMSLTLPSAVNMTGRIIRVEDASGAAFTYNITINSVGGEAIGGGTTAVISTNYGTVALCSDGLRWTLE